MHRIFKRTLTSPLRPACGQERRKDVKRGVRRLPWSCRERVGGLDPSGHDESAKKWWDPGCTLPLSRLSVL